MHALLSPSSAHIWLNCNRAPMMGKDMPDTGSEYTREGTDAHSLCEYLLKTALGMDAKDPVPDLDYYNSQMQEYAEGYRDFVIEKLQQIKETCKDPFVCVEQSLDISEYVPESFGTGDCIIIADGVMSIIDFKYGLGVIVEAENNPQLMCYALGALAMFDDIYSIDEVEMVIYQPRRENISTWRITRTELLEWAKDILKPAADLAIKGEGTFVAGEHCRFCKARAICRRRAEYNLELARYDFEQPDTLTDTEIAAVLAKVDELVSWAGDIKDYALEQALNGTHYDGFKVVEGRSVRKYTDETKVAQTVEKAGYDPYEKKLLGITAMTSLLGKKMFSELLGDFVTKPQGKPALVPESDKRPEINNAKTDFKEEN